MAGKARGPRYAAAIFLSAAVVAAMGAGCPIVPTAPNIVETAEDTASLSTLVTALETGELIDTLSAIGPFTVFAPNNAAFDALPAGILDTLLQDDYQEELTDILLGHVVAGAVGLADLEDGETLTALNGNPLVVAISDANVVTVNGETIVTADILASNGVIHIIDSVILPDIVETLEANESLSTLVTALEAADLVDELQAAGPFTVFAPTNEAFAALPAGTLDDLLLPENQAELVEILKGHVVSGQVLAADLADGDDLTDLNGNALSVTIADGIISVDDEAVITKPNIPASNGVVHVINKVILPPED